MELEQKRIVYWRRQLAQTSACTETADCIVPDAFPDVGRVVYACGTAAIGDHAPQNGRLLISGTVQTVILYEPENGGGLRRLEVPAQLRAHRRMCAARQQLGLSGGMPCERGRGLGRQQPQAEHCGRSCTDSRMLRQNSLRLYRKHCRRSSRAAFGDL